MEFVSLSQMSLNHEFSNAKLSIRLMTHYFILYSLFEKISTAQMKWTFDFDVVQSLMRQQTERSIKDLQYPKFDMVEKILE